MGFVALSLLPWLHVLTLGEHAGHGDCRHAAAEPAGSRAPVMLSAGPTDTCWVCQSLMSVLQHADAPGTANPAGAAPATLFAARAPHAPVIHVVCSANRSQAPPALA